MKTNAWGAVAEDKGLEQMTIERRELRDDDVKIDITYCGVCHSDIHAARNEWGNASYPLVPGHEIVGRVAEVGSDVENFKEGDLVGVGCIVDSCQECDPCQDNLEQLCEKGFTGTYGGKDRNTGDATHGGYANTIIVRDKFVLNIPEGMDEKAVPPLLCAGITTYSPLRQWDIQEGDKVGVVGLGGLGHMGVKLAAAMGAHVVMITTSPGKSDDAERLGADEVLVSSDKDAMKAARNSFDFILNTVPVGHDVNPYLDLLKHDCTMCIVGAIEPLDNVHGGRLIGKRKIMTGSLIGGIAETQEMLEFCAEHNVLPDIEMIDIQDINKAFDRVVDADVKYRFVIDMASLEE